MSRERENFPMSRKNSEPLLLVRILSHPSTPKPSELLALVSPLHTLGEFSTAESVRRAVIADLRTLNITEDLIYKAFPVQVTSHRETRDILELDYLFHLRASPEEQITQLRYFAYTRSQHTTPKTLKTVINVHENITTSLGTL